MIHARTRSILAEHLRHPPANDVAPPCVILSIKPHYADLIARGEKRVEFRRRFPKLFTGGRAIFYVSSPVRAITMVARITTVQRGTPAALWREFGDAGGATRAAFDEYFTGAAAGVALVLEDVRMIARPIGLEDQRLVAMAFRPPQSSAVVAGDSALVATVDAASPRVARDKSLFGPGTVSPRAGGR